MPPTSCASASPRARSTRLVGRSRRLSSGDDGAVMDRAQRVLRYLKIMQGQPPAEAGPPDRPPESAAPPPEMMRWCELHSANMQRRGEGSDVWYSHKLPSGKWCRGVSTSA